MEDEDYVKIKKTTPYYNLLKTIGFPSLKKIVAGLFLISSLGGWASFHLAGQDFAIEGAIIGLLGLALPSLVSDAVISKTLFRNEPVFKVRRLLSFSLFSSVIWVVCLLLGIFIDSISSSFIFPSDPIFVWLFLILPLRFLVLYSIATPPFSNRLISSMFTPSMCMVVLVISLSLSPLKATVSFVAAACIGYLYTIWLIRVIEKMGLKRIGVSPVLMFKGILKTLLEKDSREFESVLDNLSVERYLDIVTLGFVKPKGETLKSGIVVSNFHPGPFLNVGSSRLPKKIMDSVKEDLGVAVAVPHGVSGHEMNLVSQLENEKVVHNILDMLNAKGHSNTASILSSVRYKAAHSTCQIFGSCPLITLTLSPNDMEDIPLQTGFEIQEYIRRYYNYAAVIDTHNCISKITVLNEKDLNSLKESVFKALGKAVEQVKNPLKLGVAEIVFDEYGPEQGIGSGGGIVQIFEVASQKSAYITFDANNMLKGLRDRILKVAADVGISETEVMTTDTHEVNGLVPAKLGYHPLGEKVDVNNLLEKTRSSIEKAVNDLEDVDIFHNHRRIKVKVLGLKLFKELTSLGYKMARIIALSLFPILAGSIFIFFTLFIRF